MIAPTPTATPANSSIPSNYPRYQLTVHQYHRMAEVGILTEDSRVELIDGHLIQMSPVDGTHASCVDALTRLFASLVGTEARLRVQNAVRLSDDTEVQPDISIVRERPYGSDLPGAADVSLLTEVADSSLASDREIKVPMYARAGVPQTILVDVPSVQVWHYVEPREDGYRVVRRFAAGEQFVVRLTPSLAITIEVDDLFSS